MGYVYIMGNCRSTLYTGVTNDLRRRVSEHKEKKIEGFASRYNLTKLLYFEKYTKIMEAIIREKQIKNMSRKEKLKLIVTINPYLDDLEIDILD